MMAEEKSKLSLPIRVLGKRPAQRTLSADEEKIRLNSEIDTRRKKLKAQGSFDELFWAQAIELEKQRAERAKIERKISLEKFEKTEAEWRKTDEAKRLSEKLQAHECHIRLYEEQAKKLDESKGQRSLRASFMKLFTTSKMGLAINSTGPGKRDSRTQSNFRSALLDNYNARHPEENWVWCPILGGWRFSTDIVAGHIFPYMHGQATMNAIFGKMRHDELFSPRNGLIISKEVEEYFDSGKIVIVPDLSPKPSITQILAWSRSQPRRYKTRIIDPTWAKLDRLINPCSNTTWRYLDNKPLEFRSDFRPRARYLYFHYCVQILRRAWQCGTGEGAVLSLRDELNHLYWGTVGKHLPRNMLRAFVEELGGQYQELLDGASCPSGEANLLLHTAAAQIKFEQGDNDTDDIEENDSAESSEESLDD
jgi:HNH endonuclease